MGARVHGWLGAAAVAVGACAFDSGGLGQGSATVDDPSTDTSDATGSDAGDSATSATSGTETSGEPATDGTSGDTGASSWWDPAWAKRRRIELALPASVRDPLVDVPVLVLLDDTRIPYGEVLEGGHDLRFVDADDSLVLAYEIERWNPQGSSAVWVKVPMLGDTPDDAILMYWGNPVADDFQDANAVWGSDAAAVWHLDDRLDAPPPEVIDSSSAELHGTTQGSMGPTNVVPGWTGRALEFDGVDEEVVVGPLDTDEWTELTMSAWLYHATDGDERALSKADGSAGMDHVFFVGGIDGDVKVRVQTDGDGGQTVELKPDATLPVETWTHVAVTWTADTGDIVLFVDGQEVARDMLSGTTLLDQASDVMLANAFPAGDRSWHGRLDEVRLERIARTPAWILTQYASMTDTLAQYGAEQAMP